MRWRPFTDWSSGSPGDVMTSAEDITARAIGRLPYQYRGTQAEVLLRTLLEQIEPIARAIAEVRNAGIHEATGETLDSYGDMVGVERQDPDDAAYRARLLAAILQHRCRSTRTEILQIISILVQQAPIIDEYRQCVILTFEETQLVSDFFAKTIFDIFLRALPVATNGVMVWSDTDAGLRLDTEEPGLDRGLLCDMLQSST